MAFVLNVFFGAFQDVQTSYRAIIKAWIANFVNHKLIVIPGIALAAETDVVLQNSRSRARECTAKV